MKKFILYTVLTLGLASCSSRKVIPTEKPTPTTNINTNKEFFSKIQQAPNFDVLKINSKINVENGKLIPQLTATFYIENQKKIWANITALFGLTGARGIATPQGVKAYEKINKTYIDSDFSYFNKLLGVNFINFQALENLIIGKTFIPVDDQLFSFSQNENGFTLDSKQAIATTVNGKKYEYNAHLQYDSQLNLQKVVVKNDKQSQELTLEYTNWETFGQQKFPRNVKIIIKKQKTDQIIIENTNFDFSRMDTPYSVPSNYTKTEIK